MLSKIKKIGTVYRTVIHLKPTQIIYQIKNRLWRAKSLKDYALEITTDPSNFEFFNLPLHRNVLTVEGDCYVFEFLNLKIKYIKNIKWDDQSKGKLWNYNMQYCDFLRQENIEIEKRAGILLLLYENLWNGSLQPEPYPSSLRIMNAIRFICRHPGKEVFGYIHAEINYLSKNLEYHLLGNHLLENAFALLMGGYFFSNEKWINKARELVTKEMEEQILEDGAHFELSPMYHQIILFRVLEAIFYLPKEDKLRFFLMDRAEVMIAWLSKMTFINGSVPHFNDSTENIAYTTEELMQIAKETGIQARKNHQLKDSGFRKFSFDGFEMFMDVHGISPVYQPGHAHADTFSFYLSHNSHPVIVEPGISTYDICDKRDWERSTEAHNTLSVNGLNSSETWSGFRVGRRAKVKISEDNKYKISACHDGYRHLGVTVHRLFSIGQNKIIIEDYVEGWSIDLEVVSFLHFHPLATIQHHNQTFIINGQIEITLIGNHRLELEPYHFCNGFNSTEPAQRLRILHLEPSSITQIKPRL